MGTDSSGEDCGLRPCARVVSPHSCLSVWIYLPSALKFTATSTIPLTNYRKPESTITVRWRSASENEMMEGWVLGAIGELPIEFIVGDRQQRPMLAVGKVGDDLHGIDSQMNVRG
jgi:hypothetical protein